MINDVVSLYEAANGLVGTYNQTYNTINLIQQTNDPSYNLVYLEATKNRLISHNAAMGVQLMDITNKVNRYRAFGGTINDHMDLICLGEEIAGWTDRYKAIIIEPCMNVITHIESVRNQKTIPVTN